jgi:hypothetical protein
VTYPAKLPQAGAAAALARAALFVGLLLAAACSHKGQPYYRPDVQAANRTTEYGKQDEKPYTDALEHRVILIGDAGAPAADEPVLASLKKWARAKPSSTTVVYLGDNIYELGMVQGVIAEEERINPQIDVISGVSGVRGIFVGGNHDWVKGDAQQGLKAIRAQEAYVVGKLGDGSFYPKDGKPGPAVVPLPSRVAPALRLIVLDTQWWIHPDGTRSEPAKPWLGERDIESAEQKVVAELTAALTTPLPTIVVAHHPMKARGPHGRFFDWQDLIFPVTRFHDHAWIPIPVVFYGLARALTNRVSITVPALFAAAALYPLARRFVSSFNRQDLAGSEYTHLRTELAKALSASPPLLFVGGHEHSLQVFDGDSNAPGTTLSVVPDRRPS